MVNPGVDMPVPERHPYQKEKGRQFCRFGYPKDTVDIESQLKDQLLTPVQRLLLSNVAMRYLYPRNLPYSSWKHQRWICGTGENKEFFEINDSEQTEKSPLKAYWDQPTELENFTLFRLHLTHKLVKGWWKKCQQENIVHVFSRLPPLYKENDTIIWSTLYNCHLEEINTDLIDIFGLPKDDQYSDTELVDIDMFVSRNCRINAEKENIIVDYQTLNGNQKIIFKQIESYYNDVLNGHQIDPLRIIVIGTAGTGKTYLIKAI
ncbi:hypothetical protein RCL_jg22685.t1 [Rhizophagus clarus]|uniref:Uncharacterized protein n=1 Tax=Rhizophagus clarus TaxID=94130 RepID=A0A8H3M0T7_9GLOM|nr:hypothetical protein RCL_jg22685.t1 [Rhizophagus clarus]